MKTKIIAGLLMVSTVVPAKAQVFGPNGTAGAIVGGVVGAVIGNNNGHRTWEGAAIGAGVGMIAGAIADSNQYRSRVVEYTAPATTVYYESPVYYNYPGENIVVVQRVVPAPQRVVVVESPVVYYNSCPPPVYVNRERVVTYYTPNHYRGSNNRVIEYRNTPPPTRVVPSNPNRSHQPDSNRGRGR